MSESPLLQVAFNLPLPDPLTYRSPEDAASIPLGARVIAPVGRRSLAGFVVGHTNAAPPGVALKWISRVVNQDPLFDETYLVLASWVSTRYFASLGQSLSAMIPSGRQERSAGDALSEEPPPASHPLELSPEQQRAVERIHAAAAQDAADSGAEPSRLFYLHGVTGSGKTEVFLRLAERVLANGRSGIYLVPEISLTHQLLEAVRHRFGETVAVLHSRLTPSQRLSEWQRIRRGDARLVVGARSAVFAPVVRLGLVVVDEEHDGSYKSGSMPRYHARQIAMHRVAHAKAVMVMGSATPSAEAWHLMDTGTLTRLDLTRRLSGGALPQMRVVDMRKKPSTLSDELVAALREVHQERRQSILFLNRRGFSYFFHCRSCGYEMRCRHCSVGLTYHKERNMMVCHYCGYRARPVELCPECGSLDVGYAGFGTEQIEEELRLRFPEWRIGRIDADSVRRKGELEKRLAAFRAGEIDVLLGTQMVAKGLNFPGVKLVGIVLADTGLHLPDFRAAERTFGLIVQVAGRAGRYHPDGQVLVQTFKPFNQAIVHAVAHDLDAFYQEELALRSELRFPPFARLIRLVVRGRVRAKVEHAAATVAARLSAAPAGSVEVLGPVECPLAVIAGNCRVHLIVRGERLGPAHRAVAGAVSGFVPPSGVHLEIDVDPVSLL